MANPFITSFGDDNHEEGETGLTVNGQDFGQFPGALWMFANADRTGAADQLTVGAWSDMQLTGVEIPAVPNNAVGTVYLGLQTENLDWSTPVFQYSFTLSAAGGVPAVPDLSGVPGPPGGSPARASPYPRRVMIFGKLYTVNSVYEERALLERVRAQEQATLERLAEQASPKVEKATYRIKQVKNRINRIDQRDDYRAVLRKWDEEIVALLL